MSNSSFKPTHSINNQQQSTLCGDPDVLGKSVSGESRRCECSELKGWLVWKKGSRETVRSAPWGLSIAMVTFHGLQVRGKKGSDEASRAVGNGAIKPLTPSKSKIIIMLFPRFYLFLCLGFSSKRNASLESSSNGLIIIYFILFLFGYLICSIHSFMSQLSE